MQIKNKDEQKELFNKVKEIELEIEALESMISENNERDADID
ncbi:DNA-binding FrmR family transcriptional regulator [Neobacillus niacini]|nr:hypothetical protein [Neobacillus niacini]MDQ1003980.1 DNA-binding FrmR family transcriptional regulator [Neobacillus niacini]